MNKEEKKSTSSGKPVKPKTPVPTKEESAKIPIPYSLTEERIREIAREETRKILGKQARMLLTIDANAKKMVDKSVSNGSYF